MTRKLISKKQGKKRQFNLRKLLPLIAIFLVVILFVNHSAKENNILQTGTSHRGQRLVPPTELSNISLISDNGLLLPNTLLKGKWGLIYIAPSSCQERCIININKMYQIKKIIADYNPAFYLMVVTNEKEANENPVYKMIRHHYPTIFYVTLKKAAFKKLFNSLPSDTQNMNLEILYIADPKVNLIMSYPPTEAGKVLLKDLKKLID